MSPDSAEEIFAVRRVLEAFAVEEVSRLATPDQIQNLERLYLEFLDAARARYTRLFLRKDFSLHEMIWEISCNEYLQAALRRIVLPIFAYTTIHIVSRRAFDLLQDALSHLPLLEAIKSKDPAAARRALLVALDDWLSDIREYVFVSWKDKVRSFNRFRMNIIRKATSSFPRRPARMRPNCSGVLVRSPRTVLLWRVHPRIPRLFGKTGCEVCFWPAQLFPATT